ENLDISGKIVPQVRHRGIYETVVYDSEVTLSGDFNTESYENTGGYTFDWDHAYFTLGVSDNKGLKDDIVLNIDGKMVTAEPGTMDKEISENGISFPVALVPYGTNGFKGKFTLSMGLRGSENLSFSPVGKTTRVNLSSDWASPSFQGNFLPVEPGVNPSGFNAKWIVTHLNRSFPQVWIGNQYIPEKDAFGVNLMLEVDHYKKAERSAKYGLLFILFTFFVLMVVELRSSEKIHIFYYLLISFALILFFSLLSALSEQIGFNAAYLVSSVAVIGLLSAFFKSLLKKWHLVLLVSGLLTTLYLFIFVLLAMKDYAYLGGNIGLFILLAVLMMLSARYNLFTERKQGDDNGLANSLKKSE
ncbi:MAG TPA: cell envelope integrity protein CreD, partial [Bacteroidales bacterium]|nr:cell envelope integrity protein CreD [Bacteroidales bacterium]